MNDAVAGARRVLVQERLERHEARPHLNIRRLEDNLVHRGVLAEFDALDSSIVPFV